MRRIGIRLQVSTVLRCPRQPTNPVPNDQQPRPFERNGRCSGSYARGQRQKLHQGAEGAVEWSARNTAFVSAIQLTVPISGAAIATAVTAAVSVVNPSPGGGQSNAVITAAPTDS